MKTQRRLKRMILFLLICLFVLLPALNAAGYELVFRSYYPDRFRDTAGPLSFESIDCTVYELSADNGHQLKGYMYTERSPRSTGLQCIYVLSHGVGSNHRAYRDWIETLCTHETPVFCYDAYGSGLSGGSYSGGLPEGVRDLDAVLDYLTARPQFSDVPIRLVGHSWGAYSAGSVLAFHPEVEEALLAAGFNSSADMLKQKGQQYAGPFVYLLLPYVRLYERLKFGRYAGSSVVRGIQASDTRVTVIQGLRDTTVDPSRYGIRHLQALLKDEPDVRFIELPDSGHNPPGTTFIDAWREGSAQPR